MTFVCVDDEVRETTDSEKVVRAKMEQDGYLEGVDWRFLRETKNDLIDYYGVEWGDYVEYLPEEEQ